MNCDLRELPGAWRAGAGASLVKRQVFSALFPLVLFWAIEKLYGLTAALVVGCVAAVAEIAWEWWTQKRVSFLTWSSNGLVLSLGAVSYFMHSGVAFKLQPAVMELGFSVLMCAMRFSGEPFMIRTFRETPLDEGKRALLLGQAWFIKRLRALDARLIAFFAMHGLAVAWAAVWASSDAWVFLKGVLFYVLLVLVMVPMYKRPNGHQTADVDIR